MCRGIPVQYQPWDSEFLSQSLKWQLRITALFLLVPDTTILESAHDRLAPRGLSDFGMPSIAQAYEFEI
ncbi:hypothetical protein T12_13269 [Trichinella patagoniensis]|uniref:Uncharacterized protein n=1 Tax=Trichinella patagoniensis TaxID=990121 RepID=A0A0V0YW13_9BILA|nr:hypothetical protein T12_13269 [Trichinella patagoniensis]